MDLYNAPKTNSFVFLKQKFVFVLVFRNSSLVKGNFKSQFLFSCLKIKQIFVGETKRSKLPVKISYSLGAGYVMSCTHATSELWPIPPLLYDSCPINIAGCLY